MAEQTLGIRIKIDSDTGKLTVLNKEFDSLGKSSAQASSQLSSLDGTMAAINTRMVALVAAGYTAKSIFDMTVGSGITLNSQFEQMKLGIASLIAVNSSNTTAMGHSISTVQKFQMAQAQAAESVDLLRKANLQTPATLAQITEGYQAALGPSLRLGMSTKQTVEYVKLMTMAAAAMGQPMEQIAQESRALLSGEIDMNAQVARNLQITNEQIKMHTKQGDLYEFLTKKLGDFAAGGEAMSNSWEGISSNITDSIQTIQQKATEGIFDALKADGIDLQHKLSDNANEIADAFAHGFSGAYLAATSAAENIYLAFDIAFSANSALLNTFTDMFDTSIDGMNNKYRELGFFDYLSLGLVVAIEGFRQLGDAGLSVIAFLGSMMNKFQSITLDAFAGIAGGMGALTDLIGLDGSSFYESQAYWLKKSNAVKQDGLLIDQTQKAILGDMGKGVDRLAHSYNQLALIKDKPTRPGSNDSLTSKQKEEAAKTAAELAKEKAAAKKAAAEREKDRLEEIKIQKGYLASYADLEAKDAIEAYNNEITYLNDYADMEAKAAIDQYNLDTWYIDDLASRQANLALEFYGMIQSESDKINEKNLELFLANEGMWNTDQMQTFFEKWQESIDGIKSGMDFSANIEFDPSMMDGMAKSIAGVGKSMASLAKAEDQYQKNKLITGATASDLAKNEENHTENQIVGYANIAGAMSSMFEQGSKEAEAFKAIEAGLAIVSGAKAVVQAMTNGDPYTAIARGVAMAAMVASVLGSAGVSGGSGSTSTPAPVTSMGTVLGGGAYGQSESMTNITDLLSSIHTSEYSQLRDINRAVTSMSENILSAVTNIFRSGVTDTSGVQLNSFDNAQERIDKTLAIIDKSFLNIGGIMSNAFMASGAGLFQALGFGGSSKQYIAGSGFNVAGGTVGDKASGNVGASTYVDVETASKNFWGSASYSHNITSTALDSASSQSIALIYRSFSDTMLSINKGLGTDLGNSISGYAVKAINISTAGLTGDEVVKKLNDTFSALGDTMANDVFGTVLSQYQKLGEGMLETAVRVITEKEVLLQDLANVNKTITGNVLDITQSLVDLSGGLTKFSDANSSYFDNYFSDAEKSAVYQKNLESAYKSMNVTMPTTIAGFRSTVDALDLNTASGRETYVSLMNIADAQKTYMDSLKDLADLIPKPDMMLSKVTDTTNGGTDSLNTQLLVQVVKALNTIKTNNQFNAIGAII